MNARVAVKTVQVPVVSLIALLPAFNLDRIMARVAKENPDWSQDRLDTAELNYRRFVYMVKMDKKRGALQPTADVDHVWHNHIMFTKQYAEDCSTYLGRFMHHEPFDEVFQAFAPTYTAELFRRLFGEDYVTPGMVECTNCCDCAACPD